MFYRIEYGPATPHQRDKLPLRLIGLTCLFFTLFILAVKAAWPAGREMLTRILLPAGNQNSFPAAAQAFLQELTNGAPFYDSLAAFCRQLISYAEVPPV